MKYQHHDEKKILKAINEYYNSNLSCTEICRKHKCNEKIFFYYIRKHKTNLQNGGNALLCGAGVHSDCIINDVINSPANEVSYTKPHLQQCKPGNDDSYANPKFQPTINSEKNDENCHKLVTINTNSKKMKDYIKMHNIQVYSDVKQNETPIIKPKSLSDLTFDETNSSQNLHAIEKKKGKKKLEVVQCVKLPYDENIIGKLY